MCSEVEHLTMFGDKKREFLHFKKLRDFDSTILCCKKDIIGKNYIKRKCGWTGVLSELVTHIRGQHKENYFIADDGKLMFKWHLPSYSDQEDFGIIQNNSSFILYNFYYSEELKELSITLWNLSENKSNLYYQITLFHNRKEKPYTGKVNDIQHINNNEYVPSKIILQSDDIEQFCDEYKIFKFSLRIF